MFPCSDAADFILAARERGKRIVGPSQRIAEVILKRFLRNDEFLRDSVDGQRKMHVAGGGKRQARQRIEARTGERPHPHCLPCTDCGHLYALGERRHEYDHHLGYAAEHHLDVQAVCTLCHAKRDSARAKQTHCIRGHAFDEQNTYVAANGTRHCRACMKLREKSRPQRGSEYWARVNAKRRGKQNG
nr:hypothetical protein [Burkholderia stagnalis]